MTSELENSWIRDHRGEAIVHICLVVYNLENTFIIQSKANSETDRAGTIIILLETEVQKGYVTSPQWSRRYVPRVNWSSGPVTGIVPLSGCQDALQGRAG